MSYAIVLAVERQMPRDLKHYNMLINGEWVQASDAGTFESIDPSTGMVWATFPEATEQDVDAAVEAAHGAFESSEWRNMSPTQRGRCLRRLADILEENADLLGATETKDTGKLYRETRTQTTYLSDFYHFFSGCADKVNGETLPIDKPEMFVFTRREPIGVVAAIVPWNSQLFLAAIKIGPALAAGNTVVLKASENAPAPLLEFGRFIDRAGIPPGVVNILTGHGDPCGRSLTSHPLVERIAFTGGPASARRVVENSAANFAGLVLELGGKSPVLVFDDADVDSAVNGSLGAIFGASGQSCVAGSRLYVQESIADEFLVKLVAKAKQICVGDPMDKATDMGPLCTFAQIENILREVGVAVNEGAEVLCGGDRLDELGGHYFAPTILSCPTQDIGILNRELFGPVLAVQRFRGEEEAIRLANDTKYGLAAGVFTKDSARSLRLVEKISAGIIYVNTYRAVSPIAAHGGFKSSGYGRESGIQAIYDYTRSKTVWMNTSSQPLESQFVVR